MLKDIVETIIRELQNEKNQEYIEFVFKPMSYKIKTSFYIIVIMLILIIGNLVYSNVLLFEIIKRLTIDKQLS